MREHEQVKHNMLRLNCVSAPLLIIITAMVVFSIALTLFMHNMQNNLRSATVQFLKEDTQYRQLFFQNFFTTNMAQAQARAVAIQQFSDVLSPPAQHYLSPIPPGLPALDLVSVNAKGDGINSTGVRLNVADRTYFKRALHGERIIVYEPRESFTGQSAVLIVEPMFHKGQPHGAHLSIFSTERLKRGAISPSFSGRGRFYLTDDAGVVVLEYNPLVPIEGVPLLDFFAQHIPDKDRTKLLSSLKNSIVQAKSGYFEYDLGSGHTILFHEPLLGTGWHVFSMTPPGYLDEQAQILSSNALILCLGAVFAAGILAAYIIYTIRRNKRRVERENFRNRMILSNFDGGILRRNAQTLRPASASVQLLNKIRASTEDDVAYFKECPDGPISPNDTPALYAEIRQQLAATGNYSVQYRVIFDEDSLWMLERGILLTESNGTQSVYAVVMDINDIRRLRQTEKLTLDRMRFIMNQNNLIIFEMAIEAKGISFTLHGNTRYDMPSSFSMRDGKPQHHYSAVHPEDQRVMQEMLQQLCNGTAHKIWELRLRTLKGKFHWVNINATTLYDEDGAPFSAIGVITDINDQRSRIEVLRQQAERDSGTALYNKKTTEERIQDFIDSQRSSGFHYAMFLVDVDNLKAINDALGHQMGDKAINHVADTLRGLFREGDIVGRIGGDEFLILSTSPMLPEVAAAKAQAINARLGAAWAGSDTHILTASIGVCFFPDHGATFTELYARVDRAAYGAKQAGKGCYSLLALPAGSDVE